MKECTFKPNIVSKLSNREISSNQLKYHRAKQNEKCQQLYDDHFIRNSKLKLI